MFGLVHFFWIACTSEPNSGKRTAMSHIDSPLERKAAAERAAMGMANAKGVTGLLADRANERENVITKVVDKDGDGHISTLERFDTDGDGKISMNEYAKITDAQSGTAGGLVVGYAAEHVGASAEARKEWGQLRAAQQSGQYVPLVGERARATQEPRRYDPVRGGWVRAEPTWAGPGDAQSNRNIRSPEQMKSNPFESRLFSSHSGTHYAVADKSDETYAYSGARGIFKNVGSASYVPEHYKRTLAMQMSAPKVPAQTAPGTDVVMKGGWPTEATYGNLPEDVRPSHTPASNRTAPAWITATPCSWRPALLVPRCCNHTLTLRLSDRYPLFRRAVTDGASRRELHPRRRGGTRWGPCSERIEGRSKHGRVAPRSATHPERGRLRG